MPRLISSILAVVCTAGIILVFSACTTEEAKDTEAFHFAPVNHFLGISAPLDELRNRNAALKAHLLPYAHVLPEADQPVFRNLVRQAFADDELYLALCGYLHSTVDGDSLLAVAAELRQSDKRMMRTRLARALDPTLSTVRKEFSEDFPPDSLMLERYAVLEGGVGNAGAQIFVAAARPTLEILNTLQTDTLKMQDEQIKASLDTMQHKLHDFLTSEAMEALAFAYGTIGQDTVAQYVEFYRSPLGQWYLRCLQDAYHTVFTAAIADYTDALQRFAVKGDATVSRGNLLAFTQPSMLPESLIGITTAQVNGRAERAFVRAARNAAGNLYFSMEFNNMTPELQLDVQTQFNGEGMYPISKEQAQMILKMDGLREPFVIQLDAKSVNEFWVNHYKQAAGLFVGSLHLEFGGGDESKGRAFIFDCPEFVVSTIN